MIASLILFSILTFLRLKTFSKFKIESAHLWRVLAHFILAAHVITNMPYTAAITYVKFFNFDKIIIFLILHLLSKQLIGTSTQIS